jgi:hypothetical protein
MLLRQRIHRFLLRSRMAPTRFGRIVVRDPRFVKDLWNGRRPRPSVTAKVCAYLDEQEEQACRKTPK